MKLLKEISDKSLGKSDSEILGKTYKLRKSARGVLLNDKNEVAIQYVSKWNYHKLPGGGIDPGETVEEGLKRELVEEVGCDCEIVEELGLIIEYRVEQELLHMSHGYICRVKGEVGEPSYEQGEIDAGFKTVWVPLDEAIVLIDIKEYPENIYQAKSIIERETTFLKEAKRILNR